MMIIIQIAIQVGFSDLDDLKKCSVIASNYNYNVD